MPVDQARTSDALAHGIGCFLSTLKNRANKAANVRLKSDEADMAVFGYARVSTDGQTLASQDAELMAAGCAKVYQEKVSGARTDRAELGKLLRRIEAGDLLMVTRLDRLARSTRDLLNILHQLAEKGAKFKSLHDPWCDTSTPQGELLVTILAGFATFERHLIKARTDDGRKRATWGTFWT